MAAANTVKVTFLGDSSSLNRATTQARGEVDKFSKGISGAKKVFAGFALAGGVAGAFSFAKGLIADAAESAKVTRLTENVIRSTGMAANIASGAVADLATEISNKTGVDDEAIQSGQNLLLTFTNIKNVGADKIFNQASQAITDMTAAMNNGDVSAEKIKGTSIQLGKALNDPIKGITALGRSGVSFTEQQKAQIKAMVKVGDTAGAQKIILGELKKEFGGAAAAASSPAQKAAVAWGNLREELGAELLPVVSRVATFLSSKVIPAVSKFVQNVKSGGGGFATFRAAISNTVEFIRGSVLPLLQRFGAWFMSTALPAIKNFAQGLWRDLQPAIAAARKAFDEQLRPALENLLVKFRQAWPTIQRVLTILGQVASFILTRVVPVLIQFYAKYLATVIRVLGQVVVAVAKVVDFLIDLGKKVGEAGASFGRFVSKVAGAITNFKQTVSDGISKVIGFYKSLPQRIVDAIGDLSGKLVQKGKDLIAGFGRGAEEQAKKLPFGMGKVVGWAIDGIQKAQNSHSPAKVTMPLGEDFVDGYAKGITDNAKKAAEAAQAMIDKVRDKLKDVRSFAADLRSQFRGLADITQIDTATGVDGADGGLTALLDGLRKKAADAQKFVQAMKALRKQGLNATSLEQLREAGPDGGLAAAQNLLGGGMGGIAEVNRLMQEINRVGAGFAAGEAKRKFGIGPNATLSGAEAKVILDVRGGEDDLKKLIRKWVRQEGGDVQKVLGKA